MIGLSLPADPDRGDGRHRPGPGEGGLTDDQVAVAEREHVLFGHPAILEHDIVVLAQPMADLAYRLLETHPAGAARTSMPLRPCLPPSLGAVRTKSGHSLLLFAGGLGICVS